jgi:transcription antitermination factor NusG
MLAAPQLGRGAIGAADLEVRAATDTDLRWYAVYTSANHEKRVAQQLSQRSVENYLPLYVSVRRWKDRRVKLHLPLFPGYLFVRFALHDRLRVLQIPGIARLVSFDGLPAALPEAEIEALKNGLEHGLHVEPHPYLTVGHRVQINSGPLAGLQGILRRWKGDWRVIISLDLIHRSVVVEVGASDLEPAIG